MLEKLTFLQGINYLRANYINWQFDINNDLIVSVWYKKFSILDNEVYMQLIEQYTDSNKWPPNSPSDILDLVKTFNNGGADAFNWIVSLNEQYPLNNEFQKPKFYQELKKDIIAYELFKELEMECYFDEKLKDSDDFYVQIKKDLFIGGFGRNYTKDKFIQWYNHRKSPNILLKINIKNTLSLE